VEGFYKQFGFEPTRPASRAYVSAGRSASPDHPRARVARPAALSLGFRLSMREGFILSVGISGGDD
jgi:hypothetical protein